MLPLAEPNLSGVGSHFVVFLIGLGSIAGLGVFGLLFALVWSMYRLWYPKVRREDRGFEVKLNSGQMPVRKERDEKENV